MIFTGFLIVSKCEVVSPVLEAEYKADVKPMDVDGETKSEAATAGIVLKPKQEVVAKSTAQIVNDQRTNMLPSTRMAMTRRVHPLVSLNPYQGN
ncbi:hypothetical protein ACS0TY_003993 [Phlomoides rotata]